MKMKNQKKGKTNVGSKRREGRESRKWKLKHRQC
jgi:hypothetical protein